MKKLLWMCLCLFLIISNNYLHAQNQGIDLLETIPLKKIYIIPFDNYTGSDMKYIQEYLPELFSNNFIKYPHIEILSKEEVLKALQKKKINYDPKNTEIDIPLLKKIGLDYTIYGRYLIHEKNMKIRFKLVNLKNGNIRKSISQIVFMDNEFLENINLFAKSSAKWCAIQIFGIHYVEKISEQNKVVIFTNRFFSALKNSRIGVVFFNKWVSSFIIFILFYFFAKLTVLIFEKVLMKFAVKTPTKVDEKIVKMSKKPVKWILIFYGLQMALISLEFTNKLVVFADKVLTGIIIFLITYITIKSSDIIIREWGKKLTNKMETRIDNDLIPLFVNIARVILFCLGLLMILSRFGINIAPLIASLGIAGFAIGFAVKDSLSNVIGGIFLILDHSFAVGDKVNVDGDVGIIKEVGLRNTKLITFDNEIIVIPNGELINKKYKNSVLPDPKIRVVVDFGVAYGSDPDHIINVIIDALKKMEDICEDPAPAVDFIKMADFALNFKAKVWVPDYVNQYNKWLEATKVVYNTLNANKIDIPFPTTTVYMQQPDKK